MKHFVIKTGNGLIEFSAWLWIIIIIVSGIVVLFNDFITGILILLIGFILFIFVYYTIFLVISINDNLTEINQKLGNDTKNSNFTTLGEIVDNINEQFKKVEE